jgi:hypothetical protein
MSKSSLFPARVLRRLAHRLATVTFVVAATTRVLPAQPTVDHRAFDALLRAHVVNGAVNYDAFKNAPAFKAYLASLDAVSPAALGMDERLAYWINVYNAFTIKLIVDKGERQSIRNVNKSFGLLKLKGPWSDPIVRAAGRVLTLDQVEHDIIRKEFEEPRIHFALVCAAIGCPPLRSEAYVASRLEAQLTEQAQRFIRESPEKNRVDVPSRTVFVSMVFTWYREDFGGTDKAIGQYLSDWYPAGPERELLRSGRFSLKQTDYDWTLNSQEHMRPRALSRP